MTLFTPEWLRYAGGMDKKAEREARLKAALRANLGKRRARDRELPEAAPADDRPDTTEAPPR